MTRPTNLTKAAIIIMNAIAFGVWTGSVAAGIFALSMPSVAYIALTAARQEVPK